MCRWSAMRWRMKIWGVPLHLLHSWRLKIIFIYFFEFSRNSNWIMWFQLLYHIAYCRVISVIVVIISKKSHEVTENKLLFSIFIFVVCFNMLSIPHRLLNLFLIFSPCCCLFEIGFACRLRHKRLHELRRKQQKMHIMEATTKTT